MNKLVSPSGDINQKQDVQMSRFFKRKIKGAGKVEEASKWLPVRPFAKAGGDNS